MRRLPAPALTCFGQGDLLHVGDRRGLVHVLRQVLLLLLAVPTLGLVVGGGGPVKARAPPAPSAPQLGSRSPCPGAGSGPIAPPGSPLLSVLLFGLWGGRGRGRALPLLVVASLLVPPVRVGAVHLWRTQGSRGAGLGPPHCTPRAEPPPCASPRGSRPALTSSVSVLAEIFFLRATGLFSSVTS